MRCGGSRGTNHTERRRRHPLDFAASSFVPHNRAVPLAARSLLGHLLKSSNPGWRARRPLRAGRMAKGSGTKRGPNQRAAVNGQASAGQRKGGKVLSNGDGSPRTEDQNPKIATVVVEARFKGHASSPGAPDMETTDISAIEKAPPDDHEREALEAVEAFKEVTLCATRLS